MDILVWGLRYEPFVYMAYILVCVMQCDGRHLDSIVLFVFEMRSSLIYLRVLRLCQNQMMYVLRCEADHTTNFNIKRFHSKIVPENFIILFADSFLCFINKICVQMPNSNGLTKYPLKNESEYSLSAPHSIFFHQ